MTTGKRVRLFDEGREPVSSIEKAIFHLACGHAPHHSETLPFHLFLEPVVRPVVNGRVGHPVLYDPFLIDEILKQPDSFTMRELLSAYEMKIAVDDPAYIRDIDTLQEYRPS